ncbi:hypothetical protein [Streptomyces chartreusis]|uniref:hypothetical protein n=1 Tax=Streptomyces chartreusis TaxID=1969 RepID=UPI0036519BBE
MPRTSTLLWAMICRRQIIAPSRARGSHTKTAARELVLPWNSRWNEAVSTALLGTWCDPLLESGHLPATALGTLRAEARTLHRQLVPIWRRRTRHGRVLSLDADLGDGLSLHDLVRADVDHLTRATDGVCDDERLNRVLRALTIVERQVVFAYAAADGINWTEAAAATGATDPGALDERVRRKATRLAAEQRRRAGQRGAAVEDLLPEGPEAGTER